MESFAFKAATPQGRVIEGERNALSRAALIDELRAGGYIPIRIDAVGQGRRLSDLMRLPARSGHLPLPSITLLLKELATLLGAGISADRALSIAAKTARAPKLAAALGAMRDQIRSGAPFSSALRQSLLGMPASGLSLIEAGEASGRLADAFANVAQSLEAQLELRRSLASALIYPAILMATTLGAIFFLLTFVVPQFKTAFADAGAALPLPTVILIAVGETLQRYGLFALFVLFAGTLLLANWRATPDGRRAIDTALLRIPLLNAVLARFEIARIARTLSSLLSAKVPLARALGLSGDAIGNVQMRDGFRKAAARAREGERLGAALAAGGAWPADAVELVTIGEEAGRLDLMLANLATLYEDDMKRRTERFLAILTPALTLIMGALVAAIMGAVISAILGAYDLPT